MNQGVTSLGIKGASILPTQQQTLTAKPATNGIVLATEKKSTSALVEASSQSKVSLITPDIGMVYSGMGPDYRQLVDRARKVSPSSSGMIKKTPASSSSLLSMTETAPVCPTRLAT